MCPFNGKTHQIAVVTTAVASGEELWGGARGREKRSERRGEGWEKTRLRSKKDGKRPVKEKVIVIVIARFSENETWMSKCYVLDSIYLPRGGKCKGQRSSGF